MIFGGGIIPSPPCENGDAVLLQEIEQIHLAKAGLLDFA
jgi:hypothetical protein